MATYTKVNKETSTYKKIDRTGRGWFRQGWFTNWFGGDLYKKIEMALSTHTKIDKDIASYTETDKKISSYSKVERE